MNLDIDDRNDTELSRLDAQIEALKLLVQHNQPSPGTEHEEPYRTYREQYDALTAKRNELSTDHFLGYLAEEAWPEDWFDLFPSHAVATRAAGKNLREALTEAGWVPAAVHEALVTDRNGYLAQYEELVAFRTRITNLLDAPKTSSNDCLVERLAKLRNEVTELRNPGTVQ